MSSLWGYFYATDEERIMSFEDAVSFSEALKDVYPQSGLTLVEVPPTPIEDRAAFVHEFVSSKPERT